MGRSNIRSKYRAEDLIMYCKLLKYMRNQSSVVAHDFYKKVYKKVCKNEFRPFIKISSYPWNKQLYYAFWYSEAYGWIVVSLKRLNDVKL